MSIFNKKEVLKKMRNYRTRIKKGEYALQLIEVNYNNKCNFSCEHCFSSLLNTSGRRLTVNDIKNLSEQADELGVWQWHLQGGEPLIWPDLEDVISAIGPDKYHIMITTNGYELNLDKAERLASIGVDKISVSLDSFDENTHDTFRNRPGSYKKAIEALSNAKKAGMESNINTVVTKQNVRSADLLKILDFAERNSYTVLFVIAASSGKWAGKTNMLITENDAEYILNLKSRYKFIHRDLYPLFDFEWGCRTMNGLVYITESGDLLSCPFIHISFGNILDEPLADILKRGWRIKYFRDYNPKCLVGEDIGFISNVLSKLKGKKLPVNYKEIFSENDMYND